MLWQAQIAATSMFALSPEQGANYLDNIRELLEGGADNSNGWKVPASIPRLEDLAAQGKMRTPKGVPLPIRIVKIAPAGGEVKPVS